MPSSSGESRSGALTRTQARRLWSALAFSLVAAAAASATAPAVLQQQPDPALARILLPIVALVTAMDLAMAYVVTGSIRKRAAAGTGSSLGAVAGTQTIIACALAFGAALFACVGHFITGEQLFLALVLPSGAVFLHWFPSESRWASLTPGTGSILRSQRMMRE
jgi:FtsH-binding integral membrane protein